MGQAGGHQTVHGPRVLKQRHPDADRVSDDEQPPEAAEIRPQQKYPCHRRIRLRQDALFREAKPDADAQQLRCHRPKGTVLVECGRMLEKGGYVIKSLNTINFRKSMHYNPFAYIRSEKDILKLVNTIILNTKGDGDKSGEDFWVSATRSQAVKSLRTGNGFPLFGELIV